MRELIVLKKFILIKVKKVFCGYSYFKDGFKYQNTFVIIVMTFL